MLLSLIAEAAVCAATMATLLGLAYFPYDTDGPLSPQQLEETRAYYARAYQSSPTETVDEAKEERYVQIATLAAAANHVEEKVTKFAEDYHLADKKVLDVGSGRGNLQDIVGNYTGLDISPTVDRFYHKPFVRGSATAMPFADNSFDAVWSVWVLEHIPAPEQALSEIRRVVRPGGYIFLMPAWHVMPWIADGYNVRSYSELGIDGKLIKASIYPRLYLYSWAQMIVPGVREAWWRWTGMGPTKLRYRRLEPNYDVYWEGDSDAVNNLTRPEMALWFVSRGDTWLDGGLDAATGVRAFDGPLLIQVHKDTDKGSPTPLREQARR